jgi:hypothetical protein
VRVLRLPRRRARLVASFAAQSVVKQFLTEGERYVRSYAARACDFALCAPTR